MIFHKSNIAFENRVITVRYLVTHNITQSFLVLNQLLEQRYIRLGRFIFWKGGPTRFRCFDDISSYTLAAAWHFESEIFISLNVICLMIDTKRVSFASLYGMAYKCNWCTSLDSFNCGAMIMGTEILNAVHFNQFKPFKSVTLLFCSLIHDLVKIDGLVFIKAMTEFSESSSFPNLIFLNV